MKTLVTGATGFIGKRLSERLVKEGHEVICAGRSLSKLDNMRDKVKLLYLDITDSASVADALRKENPDIVFHCAALVESLPSYDKLMRINRDGTKNIMDACFKESIEKVVYISSISVISNNPQTPLTDNLPHSATNRYGQSKIEAEKTVFFYRGKGMKISIIRPVMVYGENEPHLLGLLSKLIRFRALPILGKADNRLQLVSVDNVVDVMLLAIDNDRAYEGTYIVADNEALTVREFFELIADTQKAKPPFTVPVNIVSLLKKLPFLTEQISFFEKERTYSIQRIKEDLGYTPRVSVRDGLRRAVLSYSKKS